MIEIKNKKVKIGCASGFWGDTSTAAKQLVDDNNIDYLVFDFLAEVTMSILAGSKLKNPDLGYATDFVTQLSPLLKDIHTKGIKIISNAGGINLEACRSMLVEEAKKAGADLKIAIVFGDDLINDVDKLKKLNLKEIDTNEPLPENILSINAYLGAPGITAALKDGADIVITGRCVDSAMVLGPLMHEFNWKHDDYDYLANGSLAGHIIECGAQCTGGNFTDWEEIKGFDNTAGLIEAMDLIISVDTSVAHLSGALNKPIWLMLPFTPDFRWLLDRDDSPWYPSMKLYRQEKKGDWDTVIQKVKIDLMNFKK